MFSVDGSSKCTSENIQTSGPEIQHVGQVEKYLGQDQRSRSKSPGQKRFWGVFWLDNKEEWNCTVIMRKMMQ